jgi:Fic-DOC domain mobile mystery protein B
VVIQLSYAAGATPLDPDETAGLKPAHIATQAQLDAWEQTNIMAGSRWADRNFHRHELLDRQYLIELHRRMFGKTWTWAGTFRKTDKTIGVDWRHVSVQLRDLLDDTRLWVDAGNVYGADEMAVRFHHRLVKIHPFPNGNGRHSRLMADLLVRKLGQPPFFVGQWRGPGARWRRSAPVHRGASRSGRR